MAGSATLNRRLYYSLEKLTKEMKNYNTEL